METNYSKKPTNVFWIDFSPRVTKSSIGHYSPLHEAWAEAATILGHEWCIINGDQKPSDIVLNFNNLTTWPAHFSIRDLARFYSFLTSQEKTKISILMYEGDFISFYFLLFISKCKARKITIHFNWSNNKQLEQYSSHFLFRWHFKLIQLLTRNNFVHYVENEPLRNLLNQRSNLNFFLFPTSTVFCSHRHIVEDKINSKISLILNDKNVSQGKFDQIIENVENIFSGFEVVIFSYIRYQTSDRKNNYYIMHYEQIDRDTYFTLLHNSWINFFFYNEENYKYLTSGRFMDSLFVKSLICVPIDSECFTWLGDRFGNLHQFNLSGFPSSEEIDYLFELEFQTTKLHFTPESTIKILEENMLALISRNDLHIRLETILAHLALPIIFIFLRVKFLLLLTKRALIKSKFFSYDFCLRILKRNNLKTSQQIQR